MNLKKLIGVFATEISSRVQGNFYKELKESAMKQGYNLAFFSATYDRVAIEDTAKSAYGLLEIANNIDFAAIIIHAQSIGDVELIKYIIGMGKQKNIPVFCYDCETLGITKDHGVITINPDYKGGFAKNVKHLIEHHNCKNIFMLAGNRNNKYSDDRIDMYKKEMTEHGLGFTDGHIGYGDFWENPATEAVNMFLNSDLGTPDAICCANDVMAIAAAKTLEKRGFKVPEDVLVTGFDGIDDGKYNFPAISTCEPELKVVADYIIDVLDGKEEAREFLIPFIFIPKESCGCDNKDNLEDKKEIARLIENSRQNTWQHHMLATMQVELIDSHVIEDSTSFINGIFDLFKGYSHIICIRDDIECHTDYSDRFDKMRIHINRGILPDKQYGAFHATEVMPDFDNVLDQMENGEFLVFRMINCADKNYGYSITKADAFIANEVKLMGQFVESFTNILESILRNMRLMQANQKLSEMYEQMSEIYIRDTMTGLYNRHGYYQELEEYIQRDYIKDGFVHIISIDMDGMKYINDNFGHMEGDVAIKAVAKAINDCFAQPCICARFGGDEFVVALFTNQYDEPSEDKISRKVNDYLKKMPMLRQKQYSVGVSIGQAVARISSLKNFKDIEKTADDSMYVNKRQRKERAQ